MMRYASGRTARFATFEAQQRGRFDGYQGYQFSLLGPPAATRTQLHPQTEQPYSIRAVTPSLRPLAARTGNRCPECAGPLVSGEGCIACPVCGFSRHGW